MNFQISLESRGRENYISNIFDSFLRHIFISITTVELGAGKKSSARSSTFIRKQRRTWSIPPGWWEVQPGSTESKWTISGARSKESRKTRSESRTTVK